MQAMPRPKPTPSLVMACPALVTGREMPNSLPTRSCLQWIGVLEIDIKIVWDKKDKDLVSRGWRLWERTVE